MFQLSGDDIGENPHVECTIWSTEQGWNSCFSHRVGMHVDQRGTLSCHIHRLIELSDRTLFRMETNITINNRLRWLVVPCKTLATYKKAQLAWLKRCGIPSTVGYCAANLPTQNQPSDMQVAKRYQRNKQSGGRPPSCIAKKLRRTKLTHPKQGLLQHIACSPTPWPSQMSSMLFRGR